MKALSIRQPWASLIVQGRKDIENRSWPTKFRGKIYVHAGKRLDETALTWLQEKSLLSSREIALCRELPRGGIVGEVDIVDCVTVSPSPWFRGPIGFVLSNPVKYESLIPCKGRLSFFEPGEDVANVALIRQREGEPDRPYEAYRYKRNKKGE